MGTPDFIDLVACDMGSSEVAWPPSSWEGEICDLSLSLHIDRCTVSVHKTEKKIFLDYVITQFLKTAS